MVQEFRKETGSLFDLRFCFMDLRELRQCELVVLFLCLRASGEH